MRERDDLQEFSGDHWGVNQRRERDGGELDFVSTLAGDGERGAELPSLGKFEAGGVVDVVGLEAFGVEQDLVPTDDCQLVGGGGSGGESAFERGGREEVEFGGDFSHTRGDVDVESEAVEQITAPFQGLASGGELQAGEIDDGPVGGVLAGDPFGVVKREVAGGRGNLQRGVEDFARSGGGVDCDGDDGRCCCPRRNCQDCDTDCSQGF